MNEIKGLDMYRAVFDALPSLIFIVDDDVRIYECNAAAEKLLGAQSATVLKKRAG
jgi:PAS domain S-box-containing protein